MTTLSNALGSTRKYSVAGAIVCLMLAVAGAGIAREWISAGQSDPLVGTFWLLALISLGLVTVWLLGRSLSFFRSFPGVLALSAMLVVPALGSDLLVVVPVIGPLWEGHGLPAMILGLVILIACWCQGFLLIRLLVTRAEERMITQLRERMASAEYLDDREGLLKTDDLDKESQVVRRVEVLRANRGIPERAEHLLADQAETDSSALAVRYGPLRALVWALPALGFIGTAATMASSIRGIGAAVDGQSGGQADFHLFTQVVPHLADAFSITLVALAATIFCYFALALVYQREEHVLVRISDLFVDLLPRAIHLRPPSLAAQFPGEELLAQVADRLSGEMWSLEVEVAKLNGKLQQLMEGRSIAQTVNTYLYLITNHLDLLSELALEKIDQVDTDNRKQHREGDRRIPGTTAVLSEILHEAKRIAEMRNAGKEKEPSPEQSAEAAKGS